MSVSDKIGGFEWLSVWNLHPLVAGLVAFGVQFLLVWMLMDLENLQMDGEFSRGQYLNFLANNGFLLPLWAVLVTVVLKNSDGITISGAWYWACLIVPVLVWIYIDKGSFDTAQYGSPSKVAHAAMVIPMGYWIVAPLPAFLTQLVEHPPAAGVLAVLSLVAACVFWGPYGDRVVYPSELLSKGPAKPRIEPHIRWDWKTWTARPVFRK